MRWRGELFCSELLFIQLQALRAFLQIRETPGGHKQRAECSLPTENNSKKAPLTAINAFGVIGALLCHFKEEQNHFLDYLINCSLLLEWPAQLNPSSWVLSHLQEMTKNTSVPSLFDPLRPDHTERVFLVLKTRGTKPKTTAIYFYSSSFRSSAENRSILACLINIHEPLFWLACCFLNDARPGQPQVTS